MRKSDRSRPNPLRILIRWVRSHLLAVWLVCLLLASGLTLIAVYVQMEPLLSGALSLESYNPPLVTSILAADGSLIAELYEERRYMVAPSELPPHLIQAFLATEDLRFYEHNGVDIQAIVRAFGRNLLAREIVQGGSTITQQVAKALLLSPKRTYLRKFEEVILAYRIDLALSKDEILHIYLNQIYFGSGAHGVEAAARTYFDKHAKYLTLSEAALLAGLPKAPSRLSPFQDIDAAKERQQHVLSRMSKAGFISDEEAQEAASQPLRLSRPAHSRSSQFNHFTEEVRRKVEARYGRDMLYKGGLTIHTTLDPKAQRIAERALDQGLRELDERQKRYRPSPVNVARKNWPDVLEKLAYQNGELSEGKVVTALVTSCDSLTEACDLDLGAHKAVLRGSEGESDEASSSRPLRMFRRGDVIRVHLEKLLADNTWYAFPELEPGTEGALVAMEPQTGRIICMVGGTDFDTSQFNRATQAVRQPGSAFKPIIYAAALDRGYTEASILMDTPLVRDDNKLLEVWKPANFDHRFLGPITFWKALVHSRNLASVKLLDSIGVDYAISYARQLGITSELTPSLSLALGASGVTPLELATAYIPFANLGERVEPYLIESIYDRNGSLIEEHQVQRERVIPPQTAYIMTNLLEGVVKEGTGTTAKSLGRPSAGKTGTTNELKDAWFVGYTPSTLAAVWLGHDDHNAPLGDGETGGRAACPVWLYFMREYLKDQPPESFSIPPGVVMARMNPNTGAILHPHDTGGTYAAFAGSPPVQELPPSDSVLAQEPQPPETHNPRKHNAFNSVIGRLTGGLGSIFRR